MAKQKCATTQEIGLFATPSILTEEVWLSNVTSFLNAVKVNAACLMNMKKETVGISNRPPPPVPTCFLNQLQKKARYSIATAALTTGICGEIKNRYPAASIVRLPQILKMADVSLKSPSAGCPAACPGLRHQLS
ncbi:MAG: hypothetical protein ABR523_10755 [Desulfurivibrionaceae bacterium]